jgi:predicted nucleic acid-binding protein
MDRGERRRGAEVIILDACDLINLFASGRVRDILASLPATFVVAKYVAEREALYTLSDLARGIREPIDLAPLAAEGLVQIVDLLTDDEMATFVELTTKVEDGEAATCALALHHGYTVATDERKVLNLIRRTMPSLRVRTTSDLVKWWSEVAAIADDGVSEALRNIQSRARFTPNPHDPFIDWWDRLTRST